MIGYTRLSIIYFAVLITFNAYAQSVGVNVPAPSSTLHINSLDGEGPFRVQNQGVTQFRIFSNNAVSFGTNWNNPIADVVRFDNAKIFMGFNSNHTPQNRLEVDGNIFTNGLIMPTGAVDGYVLKTDGNGNASWQEESGGGNASTDFASSFNQSFSSTNNSVGNIGRSVNILGDRALVGASLGAGRRYWIEFENGLWNIDNGSTESNSSQYGFSSSFNDTHFLIGDRGRNSFTGAIHFYAYSTCCITPFGEVTGSDSDANDFFGHASAFDGDYLAASAPFKTSSTLNGSVYVFRIDYSTNTLIEEEILNGSVDTRFGESLDIEGDLLVVGAPSLSPAGTGNVIIFERNGTDWDLMQIITGPEANFGNSVSLSGNKIAVGGLTGLVHVYNKVGNTYVLEEDITPMYSKETDEYGKSVKILGDDLVFGAPGFDINSKLNAGALYYYHFENNGWVFKNLYFSPDPVLGDRMGDSIGTDGVNIIGGAPISTIDNSNGRGKVVILPLE